MQREVKETMDQHGKTSRQCAIGHSSPELIATLASHESHPKQANYEKQSQCGSDDSAVREYLQIIVVYLLQSIESVARIVACVNHSEGPQPDSDNWMVLYYVYGHSPEMSSSCGWIVSVDTCPPVA